MNKVQIILDSFSEFETIGTSEELFQDIFGESDGFDLYTRYILDAEYNLLVLWRLLTKQEQVKLSSWMLDNIDDLQFLALC